MLVSSADIYLVGGCRGRGAVQQLAAMIFRSEGICSHTTLAVQRPKSGLQVVQVSTLLIFTQNAFAVSGVSDLISMQQFAHANALNAPPAFWHAYTTTSISSVAPDPVGGACTMQHRLCNYGKGYAWVDMYADHCPPDNGACGQVHSADAPCREAIFSWVIGAPVRKPRTLRRVLPSLLEVVLVIVLHAAHE